MGTRKLREKSMKDEESGCEQDEKSSATTVKSEDSKKCCCSKCSLASNPCLCDMETTDLDEDMVMNRVISTACLLSKCEDEETVNENTSQSSTFGIYIINDKGKVNGYELKHIGLRDPSDDEKHEPVSIKDGIFRFDRKNKKVPPQEFYGRRKGSEDSGKQTGDIDVRSEERSKPIIVEISEISDAQDVVPRVMNKENNGASSSRCDSNGDAAGAEDKSQRDDTSLHNGESMKTGMDEIPRTPRLPDTSSDLSDITLMNNPAGIYIDVEFDVVPNEIRASENTEIPASFVDLKEFVDNKSSEEPGESCSHVSGDKTDDADGHKPAPGDIEMSSKSSLGTRPSTPDGIDSSDGRTVNLSRSDDGSVIRQDPKSKEAEAMKNVIRTLRMQASESDSGSVIGNKVGLNNASRAMNEGQREQSDGSEVSKYGSVPSGNKRDGEASVGASSSSTTNISDISVELKAALLGVFIPPINQREISNASNPSLIGRNTESNELEAVQQGGLQGDAKDEGVVGDVPCIEDTVYQPNRNEGNHSDVEILSSESSTVLNRKLNDVAERVKNRLSSAHERIPERDDKDEKNRPIEGTIVFVEVEDLNSNEEDSFEGRNVRNNKVGRLIKFFEAISKGQK